MSLCNVKGVAPIDKSQGSSLCWFEGLSFSALNAGWSRQLFSKKWLMSDRNS